ncbi:MAG: imidazoleglycerol-phosphate dehydratase HisB [Gammaproteobacteria bacterium]|nr:imidazoleglycerol-phosphate dehydratase HisB [Gammaproteobacteria bacterium]
MHTSKRRARVERDTHETQICVEINLDGTGEVSLQTGIPFFEHMLHQIARHGLMDMRITAKGDLEIDDHHTVEDVGIVLGQAIAEAVGEKRGIQRYGHAYVPLDEALSRVVIDLSGRPGLFYRVEYTRSHVGRFDVDLIREFFQGLVNSARMTVHLDCLQGTNSHHIAETLFKAFGRALRMALTHDPRAQDQVPSTKGTLASSLSVDTRSG